MITQSKEEKKRFHPCNNYKNAHEIFTGTKANSKQQEHLGGKSYKW